MCLLRRDEINMLKSVFRDVVFTSAPDVEDCRRNSTTKFACRFVGFPVSGSSTDGLVVYGWPGFPFFGRLRQGTPPLHVVGEAAMCRCTSSSGLVRVGVPAVRPSGAHWDRCVDICHDVVAQLPVGQTIQKTLKIPQLRYIDKMVDVPVVQVVQSPQVHGHSGTKAASAFSHPP